VDLPEDDRDNFTALDFSSTEGAAGDGIDALADYAPPAPEHDGADLDALDGLTEAPEEYEHQLFTVTNPQGSVSVSVYMDGRIQHVGLTDKVTRMKEPKLAEEVFVIADLARQKARAAQFTFMLDSMSEVGTEEETAFLREFVGMTMNLPTPEQAEAAQEEVFATRYNGEYE
jgi:hypothetical protein